VKRFFSDCPGRPSAHAELAPPRAMVRRRPNRRHRPHGGAVATCRTSIHDDSNSQPRWPSRTSPRLGSDAGRWGVGCMHMQINQRPACATRLKRPCHRLSRRRPPRAPFAAAERRASRCDLHPRICRRARRIVAAAARDLRCSSRRTPASGALCSSWCAIAGFGPASQLRHRRSGHTIARSRTPPQETALALGSDGTRGAAGSRVGRGRAPQPRASRTAG